MYYPMQNNIGCIHFVVVSLQVCLYKFKKPFAVKLSEYRVVVRYSNVGMKKNSVMYYWHCRHVFLLLMLMFGGALDSSGCVVECRICNWEVAGSNLGLGYFAPRSTQPSIPPGSVKWVPVIAGKAKAGMAYSDCWWTCRCAGKTVKCLENTCHTWALLWWWFTTKRRYQVYGPFNVNVNLYSTLSQK